MLLRNDDNSNIIQVGSYPQLYDDTPGTPVKSGDTISALSSKTLKVPNNAAELIITPSSEIYLQMDGINYPFYDEQVFPVARVSEVIFYNPNETDEVTIYFWFNCV